MWRLAVGTAGSPAARWRLAVSRAAGVKTNICSLSVFYVFLGPGGLQKPPRTFSPTQESPDVTTACAAARSNECWCIPSLIHGPPTTPLVIQAGLKKCRESVRGSQRMLRPGMVACKGNVPKRELCFPSLYDPLIHPASPKRVKKLPAS